MQIEDGTGKGFLGKVDTEGQLHVRSQNHKEARHHAASGEVFLLSSGYITSSAVADTFVSVFYVKNDSTTKNVYIGQLRTCTEVPAKWKLIENATSISNSTSSTVYNSNISSAITFDGTAEFGSATSATTGGNTIGTWITNGPGHSIHDYEGSLILGPQDSLVIEMAPFASAAGEVCILIECWQNASE